MEHHPTVIIDGERWNVIGENEHVLIVVRHGLTRSVKREDVR